MQQLFPHVPPLALHRVTRGFGREAVARWAFRHYLEIAPPRYALERGGEAARGVPVAAAA